MSFLKIATVAALAAAVSASPAGGIACGPAGPTTTTLVLSGGPTSTHYASSFGDGVFLDCHGYSTVEVVSTLKVTPTTTVNAPGEITTASYMCSPTPQVPCGGRTCPNGALTTTITHPGGKTATAYSFTELTVSTIGCSGYSTAAVHTTRKVAPTTTVHVAGTAGAPRSYTCKASPSCTYV